MDSNTTSYKQIDDRGRNDLERIIEELTNANLILKEQKYRLGFNFQAKARKYLEEAKQLSFQRQRLDEQVFS